MRPPLFSAWLKLKPSGPLPGWLVYGEESDGIFCPGGSYSNMLAMHMARVRFLERNKGMTQDKLACFVSEGAHYSFDRGRSPVGVPAGGTG